MKLRVKIILFCRFQASPSSIWLLSGNGQLALTATATHIHTSDYIIQVINIYEKDNMCSKTNMCYTRRWRQQLNNNFLYLVIYKIYISHVGAQCHGHKQNYLLVTNPFPTPHPPSQTYPLNKAPHQSLWAWPQFNKSNQQ